MRHVLGRFPVPQESVGRGGVEAAPGLWQPWTSPGSCCPLRSCFLRVVSPLAWAALGQQGPRFCSRPCSSPFPQLLLCLAQQLCGCRESQGSTLLQSQGSTLLQLERTLRQYPC